LRTAILEEGLAGEEALTGAEADARAEVRNAALTAAEAPAADAATLEQHVYA